MVIAMSIEHETYHTIATRIGQIDIADPYCKYDIHNIEVLIHLLTTLNSGQQKALRNKLYLVSLEATVQVEKATEKLLRIKEI